MHGPFSYYICLSIALENECCIQYIVLAVYSALVHTCLTRHTRPLLKYTQSLHKLVGHTEIAVNIAVVDATLYLIFLLSQYTVPVVTLGVGLH